MGRASRFRVITKKYKNAEGFDELLHKLGMFAELRFKSNELRFSIRGILQKSGFHVRDAAIALAPEKPADIQKALQSAFGKDKQRDPSTIVWALFAISPWWHWWEFGTKNRITKKGAFRGQIQAYRFLRRGAMNARPAVAADVGRGLRELFKEYEI